MKLFKSNYFFAALLAVIFLFNFAFTNSLTKISPTDAYKMQTDKTAIIVDVRELSEQKQARVKNALSLPMSIMDNNKAEFEKIIATYPKDKKIIVYCHSGRRSGIVGTELDKKGFKILNLGAFDAWKSQGLPTE